MEHKCTSIYYEVIEGGLRTLYRLITLRVLLGAQLGGIDSISSPWIVEILGRISILRPLKGCQGVPDPIDLPTVRRGDGIGAGPNLTGLHCESQEYDLPF